MGHPTQIKRKGVGVNDNDILFTLSTSDLVRECNEHFIRCTAGTVDLEVTIDDGVTWTDSTTFPIAVLLLNATAPGTLVTSVTTGQVALFLGHVDGIRAKQVGVPASAAHISSNPR